MPEKNKAGNLILEVLKLVVVIPIMLIAYTCGALTNEDGSFDTSMSLFVILPLFVVGRSAYNFYRNYKYRKK
jgi:hypothetical protein